MPADIGELQDAAKSRREKLMAMRAKVSFSGLLFLYYDSNQRKGGNENSTEEPALKLRNYKPLDENISRDEIEPADVEHVDEHVEELENEATAPGIPTFLGQPDFISLSSWRRHKRA